MRLCCDEPALLSFLLGTQKLSAQLAEHRQVLRRLLPLALMPKDLPKLVVRRHGGLQRRSQR